MFDITKYAQLKTKKERAYYAIAQISIFSFFIIISVLFIKELIFPTQIFKFKSSIDSLANTISRPYELQTGTSFHIFANNESNYAEITITLPKELPKLPTNTTLSIKKSYLAFLTPINTQKYDGYIAKIYDINDTKYLENDNTLFKIISENILNSYLFKNTLTLSTLPKQISIDEKELAGFAPATLISSKSSIYITDKNTKHPLQDERAFKSLGYNFDNVIQATSEERAMHKNAKLFTSKSIHPFGTFFYTTDSKRIFVFDNDLLNKIPPTLSAKQHSILTQEASRTTTSDCLLKKTIFPRQYKCKVSLKNISAFDGNTYQLSLVDSPNTKIEAIQIKLFTTLNKKSLNNRIESIKRKINTTYN